MIETGRASDVLFRRIFLFVVWRILTRPASDYAHFFFFDQIRLCRLIGRLLWGTTAIKSDSNFLGLDLTSRPNSLLPHSASLGFPFSRLSRAPLVFIRVLHVPEHLVPF